MGKLKHNKNTKKVSIKKGLSAGSLVFVGDTKMEPPRVSIIEYNADEIRTQTITQTVGWQPVVPAASSAGVTWINIDGLQDIALIERLGARFGIDRLTLEDLLNTTQRPKLDEFKNYVFLIVNVLGYQKDGITLDIEQISFVLGSNFVLSFQEIEGDTFDSVRQRLQKSSGLLRNRSADFLLYSLLDTIVDNYFEIMEKLSEKIEILEEKMLYGGHYGGINEIYALKKELTRVRKSIYPLREVIAALDRNDSRILAADTKWFIRDIYDHTLQVIDHIETFRDTASALIELHMSNVSNKMNEVMKLLTVISTIFIPLTFIAGVYGMNFENMPELKWHYGYFEVWGVMIVIAIGMIYYFKRKEWM